MSVPTKNITRTKKLRRRARKHAEEISDEQETKQSSDDSEYPLIRIMLNRDIKETKGLRKQRKDLERGINRFLSGQIQVVATGALNCRLTKSTRDIPKEFAGGIICLHGRDSCPPRFKARMAVAVCEENNYSQNSMEKFRQRMLRMVKRMIENKLDIGEENSKFLSET